MTTQQQMLFDNPPDGPLSRRTDPAGSYVAASQYKAGGKFKTDKRSVLAALRLQGLPITSKNLARKMNADRHTVAKRLPDLEREGLAKRAGHDPQTKETLWAAT